MVECGWRHPTCVVSGPGERFRGWDTLVGAQRDEWPVVGLGGVGLGGATRLSSTLGTRIPAKRAGFRCARGAYTFSLCSRNVTVWQVVSRHIQRRIVPPDPHRDPGPGRVDHLHHHTPVTLSKSPQPPTNIRSPTLNSEEPVWRSVLSNLKTFSFLCDTVPDVLMHRLVLGAF